MNEDEIVHVDFRVIEEQRKQLFEYVKYGHYPTTGYYFRERFVLFRKLLEHTNFSEKAFFVVLEQKPVRDDCDEWESEKDQREWEQQIEKQKREVTFSGKEFFYRGFYVTDDKPIDVVFEKEFYEFLRVATQKLEYTTVSDCAGALARFIIAIEPYLRRAEKIRIFAKENGFLLLDLMRGVDF